MIGTYIDLGSMTSLMSAGSTAVSTSSTTDYNIDPDALTTTLTSSTTTAASSTPYNTMAMDTTQRYVESLSDDELMRFSELVDEKLNDNSFENNKLIDQQEDIPKVKTK